MLFGCLLEDPDVERDVPSGHDRGAVEQLADVIVDIRPVLGLELPELLARKAVDVAGVSADAASVALSEVPGVWLSAFSLEVEEGGSAGYTAVLTSLPTGSVTVTPSVTGEMEVMQWRRDLHAPRQRRRRQHPAIQAPVPVIARHGSQIARWPAGAPAANALSAPDAPPVDRCQPARASHPAITVMSARVEAGVARAPIPA